MKKNNSIVESYTYDVNGNRETETNTLRGVYDRVFTYSEEDYILTAGDDVYQFDKDGFLTQRTTTGTTTFNYSSRGESLEVVLPDGTIISYDNDPMGRRIAKKINGVVVEKYFWSGLTRLLAVYDGEDNLISRFTYADARMPMSMEMGGNTYYLLYDQVGSLRAVADSAGNIIKRVDYDSFGNIIYESNPGFTIPFGFAGGLHDRDTGLVRFGARDYDPAIGRWTAKDPIDFAGGDVNLYGYVQNDPVNWVDPWGLWTLQIGLSGTGGAGGGGTAGGGLVFGYSRESGFQFGTYEVAGGGGFGGVGGSGTVDITFSWNTDINQLCGSAGTVGGSITLPGANITGGAEVNMPMSDARPSTTFSFGLGVGTPVEMHGFKTYTWIQEFKR